MLRFSSVARSHVGLVRENNEDAGFSGPYLQLVADGVGGCAAGEVASATAAYVVSALTMMDRSPHLLELLDRAVETVQSQLRAGVTAEARRAGMGTTLTAILTDQDRFAMVHVGDSRAYLLRDGDLVQLTHDHTLVQHWVDAGQLTAAEARTHPRRSVVLKALDGTHDVEANLVMLDLEPGDRLLLCSDGLTDYAPPAAVHAALRVPDKDEAVARLVDAALRGGGRDNVTCLLADVEDGPVLCRDGRLVGALADPHLVVDPAAVHVPHPA
ncbi:MAG: PP2C family protein-serine/threonine phosphatase [Nocardioidaceae bacterium]